MATRIARRQPAVKRIIVHGKVDVREPVSSQGLRRRPPPTTARGHDFHVFPSPRIHQDRRLVRLDRKSGWSLVPASMVGLAASWQLCADKLHLSANPAFTPARAMWTVTDFSSE